MRDGPADIYRALCPPWVISLELFTSLSIALYPHIPWITFQPFPKDLTRIPYLMVEIEEKGSVNDNFPDP